MNKTTRTHLYRGAWKYCPIFTFVFVAFILIFYGYIHSFSIPQIRSPSSKYFLTRNTEEEKKLILDNLAEAIQQKIRKIQNISNCASVNKLYCGNNFVCGFGCQIHHRMACVMLSYATGLPFIHDLATQWPFNQNWTTIFESIGSTCPIDENTYTVNWATGKRYPYIRNLETNETIAYPFANGLTIPFEIHEILEKYNADAFIWWVAQFASYTVRPTQKFLNKIEDWKNQIGFQLPIIGMHIRRTDKGFYSTEKYFEKAKNISAHSEYEEIRRVFIASDDHRVLGEAKELFGKSWDIIGFPSNRTLINQKQRMGDLESIVRDAIILSQCNYVICYFNSNICGFILEYGQIVNKEKLHPTRVIALDDIPYTYSVFIASGKFNTTLHVI